MSNLYYNIEQLEKYTEDYLGKAIEYMEKTQEHLNQAYAESCKEPNKWIDAVLTSVNVEKTKIEEYKKDINSIKNWLHYLIRGFRSAEKANLIAAGTYTPFQYDINVMKNGHGNGEVMDNGSVASRTINYGVDSTMNIGAVMDDGYTASRTIGEGKSINYPNKPFKDTHATQSTEKGVIATWIDKIVDKFKKIASTGAEQLMSLIGITKTQAIPETKTTDNTQINQDIGNNSTPNNGIGGNSTQPTTPEQPSVTIPEVITPDPIPTPEPTISEKIQLSKEKMVKYFNEHEDYGISEEKINEVFSSILIASSDEEFEKMAEKYGYSNCENINAITYNNGEIIILRPGANQEDIIKEAVYSLGSLEAKKDRIAGSLSEDIKEDTGDQNATLKESNDSRGINMAAAEKISYEILEKNDLSSASDNCKVLQEMDEQLGKIGEEDIVNKAFFNETENPFAVKLNEVTENEETYRNLIEAMEITDEFGTEKDEQKIQEAKKKIESIQNVLELKVNAKLS